MSSVVSCPVHMGGDGDLAKKKPAVPKDFQMGDSRRAQVGCFLGGALRSILVSFSPSHGVTGAHNYLAGMVQAHVIEEDQEDETTEAKPQVGDWVLLGKPCGEDLKQPPRYLWCCSQHFAHGSRESARDLLERVAQVASGEGRKDGQVPGALSRHWQEMQRQD